MPRSNSQITKASLRVSKTVYRNADKAFTHFSKWVTTDHSGFSRAMDEMPKMGFIDSLKYAISHLHVSVIGSLISGVLVFILIAFGIPLLIKFLLM